jgi:hypothetical protein
MDFSTRLDRHLTGHLRWYSLIVWIVAAAIAIGPMLADSNSSFLNGRLGDQDDMLRLKQVKDLLGLPDADPKSWYDLREPRIAPPLGLDSHWSRLLDGARLGVPLRDMAAVLVDPACARITSGDWVDSAERKRLRRWLAEAARLVEGGYRTLLGGP